MNARSLAVCGLLVVMPCAPAWTAEKPPSSEVPASDVYACPMHPDVRAPMGRCPQCGMRLRPADTGAKPRHGGHVVTAGRFNVEFVETAGEVHVYLYDAHAQPLPVDAVRGAVMHFLEPQAGDYGPPVALEPNARMGCLIARKPSGGDFNEVSAVIPYKNQELQVGCSLRAAVKGQLSVAGRHPDG